MKKILVGFQASIFTLIILLFGLSWKVLDTRETRISINDLTMDMTTIKVELDSDNYRKVLVEDTIEEYEQSNFKKLLTATFNSFALEHQISLVFGKDYNFTVVDIDQYQKIKNFEIITVNVSADINSKKIIGSFNSEVNLIRKPKSISSINIEKQTFSGVTIDETTFGDALESCLEIISENIKNVTEEAQEFIDYVVNIEGHYWDDPVTKDDLGTRDVNVNSVTNEDDHLLEGSFTFQLDISISF